MVEPAMREAGPARVSRLPRSQSPAPSAAIAQAPKRPRKSRITGVSRRKRPPFAPDPPSKRPPNLEGGGSSAAAPRSNPGAFRVDFWRENADLHDLRRPLGELPRRAPDVSPGRTYLPLRRTRTGEGNTRVRSCRSAFSRHLRAKFRPEAQNRRAGELGPETGGQRPGTRQPRAAPAPQPPPRQALPHPPHPAQKKRPAPPTRNRAPLFPANDNPTGRAP